MKKLILIWALLSIYGYAEDTIRVSKEGLLPNSRVNAIPTINKIMEACKTRPNTVILFEKGRYDFWPHQCIEKIYFESNTTDNNPKRCALLIENLNHITIDGQHADFIFHDRMQPFTVDKSKNIIH